MNQKLIKALTIISLLVSAGCKPPNLLKIISHEYNTKSIRLTNGLADGEFIYTFYDGKYLGMVINDTTKKEKIIFGRLLGNIYGHRFEFDKQNILARYIFDVDNGKHYSYGIQFSNKQYSENGNPYVDCWADKSYFSQDSTRYIFLFAEFPRKNVQALYSYDSTKYLGLNLDKSKVMPYLGEGKIIVPNNIKVIYFKIDASDLLFPLIGLEDKKVFLERDSL
jgi:hypothetical protein